MKKLIKKEITTLNIENSAENIISQLQDMIKQYGADMVSCGVEEYEYSDGSYIAIYVKQEVEQIMKNFARNTKINKDLRL